MFWIDVNEKQPNNSDAVLAVTDNNEFVVASFIDGEWEPNEKAIGVITEYACFAIIKGDITHWQPLPLLPDQEMHKRQVKIKKGDSTLRSFQ